MPTTARGPKSRIPADGARLVGPNFITEIIDGDLRSGRVDTVVTRFPPEPNGYAHIGHAIASFLNFGLARDYGGLTKLRMDDTNPEVEKLEYAEALIRDLSWLGWQWAGEVSYASNYFGELYEMAVKLVRMGKAYVDSVDEEEMARLRGTVDEPGTPSPYRERSVAENLELLERMKSGEFEDGAHVLRAKIDLSSPNMKLRDPVLYRIVNAPHYRTGDAWHIYPSYDFAQAPTDALDGVTHSLCSLEFVDNRAVYDWLMDNLWEGPRPYQYEFGRRSLEYTVVSKRKLIQLVEKGHVSGWDDPRMPTLAGLRRRGVRPEAVRDFASRVGISRTNRTVDIALLDYAIRDDLNSRAPRVMAVLEPLKVVITNYEGAGEMLEASYWPPDVDHEGSREVPFGPEIYLERGDFAEHPPKGFKRLSPGEHVRLRHAYVIRCDEVVKNEQGEITELRCSYDPDSLGQNPSGVKVKGAVHWVEVKHAVPAEFRLYDRLFSVPNPDVGEEGFLAQLNPDSLQVARGYVEASVRHDPPETRYQFERQGYFWRDPEDSRPEALIFGRIVSLKDSWIKSDGDARVAKKEQSRRERSSKVAFKPGDVRDPVLDFGAAQKAQLESLLRLGVSRDDAVLIAESPKLSRYFHEVLAAHDNPQSLANWLVNELRRELPDGDPAALPFTAADFADLLRLIDEEVLTSRLAKEVLAEMLVSGRRPGLIVEERGLEQLSDEPALASLAQRLVAEYPDKVEAYREGKTGLLGFFIGQAMRETSGKANPQLLQDLLRRELDG